MTHRFRFYSKKFEASADPAGAASTWLRELAGLHGLSEDLIFRLDLCANELLANLWEHVFRGGEGAIEVELLLDRDAATLTVTDSGPPFDPLAYTLPALPARLEEAADGGLGLRLVRHFADSVHYERYRGGNRSALRFGCRTLQPRTDRRRARGAGSGIAAGAPVACERRSGVERRKRDLRDAIALFHDVDMVDVNRILQRCELRPCSAGELLFAAGEYHRCVLVAIEGRLEVHLDGADSKFYFELPQGECVGELSVADGKPISAWVIAASDGRLLAIPEPVFLQAVLSVPAMARNLVAMLSERMRRSNGQVVERLRATLELESLQRELSFARQVQASMLPMAPLFSPESGLQAHGFMRAAQQVGGDFYDAFVIDEGRLFVAIGDVCNKGTAAALFMVRTLTLLRSEALRGDEEPAAQLVRIVTRCNELLAANNEAQQFVTLFCAIVDTAHDRLYYVNAGHNPPLLCAPGEAAVFVDHPRNPIAGMVPGLRFKLGEAAFARGSLLLLYTDGVTEAEAADGRPFGEDALRAILDAPRAAHVALVAERIVTEVDAFAAGHPQSDDITLLALRRL